MLSPDKPPIDDSPGSRAAFAAVAALCLLASQIAIAAEGPIGPSSLYHRRRQFVADSDVAFFTLPDSFPIADSLDVKTNEIPLLQGTDYRFDPLTNVLTFTPPLPSGTYVEITYDALLLGVPKRESLDIFSMPALEDLARRPPTPGERPLSAPTPFGPRQGAPLLDAGLLNVTGAKTFGISAGNRRSFAPDQSLQLRLDGEILPGIAVDAVLSDQQLPFQPEGTTEELDRLDQVLIRIAGRGLKASLGDDTSRLEGPELVLFPRRMQGVQASGRFKAGNAQFIVALPKGFSDSATFVGVEGQSEYRVTASGRFVAMVAGSEHVWLNGEEMTRGESNDYVIRDYGDPIIEFTPKHLITRNDIIRVDFDYIPENEGWQRSFYAMRAGLNWANGAGELGVSVAREADDRSRPLAFITDEDIERLRRGLKTTPEGRALTPPTRRSIVDVDARWNLAESTQARAEWAFYRADLNTFDPADSPDESVAWKASAQTQLDWLTFEARGERLGATFQPIGATGSSRIRTDYGAQFSDDGFGDALLGTGFARSDVRETPARADYSAQLTVQPIGGASFSGAFGVRSEDFTDDALDSLRRNWRGDLRLNRPRLPSLQLRRRASRVRTAGQDDFRKFEDALTIGYDLGAVNLSYSRRRFDSEDENIADGADRNRRQTTETVSAATEIGAGFSASLRHEREQNAGREPILAAEGLPIGFGSWKSTGRARTLALDLRARPTRWADVSGTFGRRVLSQPQAGQDLRTNVASLEARLSPLRDALNMNVRYEMDKRLTSRREEVYTNVILIDGVPVPIKPGQGTYVKVDEYHYVEDPEVGDYVRLIRTVGDTPVTAVEAQLRARFDPGRLARGPARIVGEQPGARPASIWADLLDTFTVEARWNITEEQEDARVVDLLRLRNLRTERSVFGRGIAEYRLDFTPARFLSVDLDWNENDTLNRRLNSQSRRLDASTQRSQVRLMPTERWTLEWNDERRRSLEVLEGLPTPASEGAAEASRPTEPFLISRLRRDERQRSAGARFQLRKSLNIGARLAWETEDSSERATQMTRGKTESRAIEALLTWLAPGKGRADVIYRLARGRSEGELSAVAGFRFYEGLSQDLRVRADYRVQSFTALTFRLNYRLLATEGQPTEQRFDLQLVAEL